MQDYSAYPQDLVLVFSRVATMFTLRYFIMAGLTFLVVYVLLKQAFRHYKIQKREVNRKAIYNEIRYSVLTGLIAGLFGILVVTMKKLGLTQLYLDLDSYGYTWLVLCLPVLFVIHDAYFYWMHRLSHNKLIYRTVHEVHHRSHNPTPWAAYSFHPLETVWELGFIPLIVILMPIHPLVLLPFIIGSTAFNIMGHLGYEFLPKGWVHHPVLKYINASTHHNLHHTKYRGNYGLYFNWWDRWCGTQFANYEAAFDGVKENVARGKAEKQAQEEELPAQA